MTHDLTGEKLEDYRLAFNVFDANHDGYITLEEIQKAMNKCGQHPTQLELKLLMKQADKDQNGVITFDEFVDFMKTPKRCLYTAAELREQFALFDRDRDGYITREEMLRIVGKLNMGDDFPMEVVDLMFQDIDTNNDGKISLEEFVAAMQ